MERFIGLDAHASTCTFGVIDKKGKTLKVQMVETNGQALIEFLHLVPGRKHLCLEECEQSQWLHEILSPQVDEIAIVLGEKIRGNKNDGVDAIRLAERMRTGDIGHKIYKAPSGLHRLRELTRVYNMVNVDQVRTKCRIKSFYRSRGIWTGTSQAYSAKNREGLLAQLSPGARQAVELLYEQLDYATDLKAKAQKAMQKEACKHPIVKLLGTAPGVGPIRSSQLMATIVTPHRFRTSRQFWAYCGLAIVMRSSSDWTQSKDGRWVKTQIQQTRGLNHNHNRLAKNIFKGAATTVITKLHGIPLYLDYQRLLQEKVKPNLAKLTIARKIAAITLAMWKKKEAYNPEQYRKQLA